MNNQSIKKEKHIDLIEKLTLSKTKSQSIGLTKKSPEISSFSSLSKPIGQKKVTDFSGNVRKSLTP